MVATSATMTARVNETNPDTGAFVAIIPAIDAAPPDDIFV